MTKAKLWKDLLMKLYNKKKLKGNIKTLTTFLTPLQSIKNKEYMTSFPAMATFNFKC